MLEQLGVDAGELAHAHGEAVDREGVPLPRLLLHAADEGFYEGVLVQVDPGSELSSTSRS